MTDYLEQVLAQNDALERELQRAEQVALPAWEGNKAARERPQEVEEVSRVPESPQDIRDKSGNKVWQPAESEPGVTQKGRAFEENPRPSPLPQGETRSERAVENNAMLQALGELAGEIPGGRPIDNQTGFSGVSGVEPDGQTWPFWGLRQQLPLEQALKKAENAAQTAQFSSKTGRVSTSLEMDLSKREVLSSWAGQTTDSGWKRAKSVQDGMAAAFQRDETAQRVDRAFRRDSRRYDGGFFLY